MHDPSLVVAFYNPVVERFEFSIGAVGVSVVDDSPEELLYTQATGVLLLIQSTLEGDRTLELTIKDLQANDQRTRLETVPASFPVVVGKTRFLDRSSLEPLLKVVMTKSVATSIPNRISLYSLVDVMVQEMDVAIEESLITSIMATFNNTASARRKRKGGARPAGKTLLRVQETRLPPHPGSDLPTPKPFSKNWYFYLLRVHPIVVNVSFKQAMEIENRVPHLEGVRDMMAASGLSSLHNVRFHIHALEMRNLFGEKNGIIETFHRHYSNQAILEAYKILGSSGLLGDPVGLTTGIGNSVAQFVYRPIEAFTKADGNVGKALLHGSFGLVSGVTRTVAATAGKTVGAVAAVAESIRRPAFARNVQREDSTMVDTIDSESVVGGLGMGASSVAGRVGSGLCTVWEMALTPLTVSLEGASHSLEFLGDNKAEYSEALHRTRPPRVFDKEGYVQVYSHRDASAMAQLRRLDQGLFGGEGMIGLARGSILSEAEFLSASTEESPLEEASTGSGATLVLTSDSLVAMGDGLSHSTWRVSISEIRGVRVTAACCAKPGNAGSCLEFEVGKASHGNETSFFPLLGSCASGREAAGIAASTFGGDGQPAVDVPLTTLRFNCEEDSTATLGMGRGAKGMMMLIEEHRMRVRHSMRGSRV